MEAIDYPWAAMMALCHCVARRIKFFSKNPQLLGIKPLISLPPATVHGVVFRYFCCAARRA
ncbi:hypothetical protein J4G43_020135 [Bradyrhizobium barranii subsp. barranii]|uniref:Uncharacterized protein n=1 Tax=Bradyrhizobium barranii subsp. barranii TaxID=2823807 RepID=A0A939M5N1_9BRAD|nr:hypothetical protein [Bradyrhizobium barranii]UEM16321.1 hypothetical protein J4G43_020135 [Bradyrhizobium barranii subsp. barranii]